MIPIMFAVVRGLAAVAAASIVVGLSSCVPNKAIPVPPYVASHTPVQRESAYPTLNTARKVSGNADAQAAVSAAQLAQAQQTATTAQRKAREALADADRLVKQKSATEAELVKQKSLVSALCDSMDVMELNLSETSKSLVKEKDLRVEVSAMLDHAQDLVRDKDEENGTLRLSLKESQDQADLYFHSSEKNAKAAMDSDKDAAKATGKTEVWFRIAMAAIGVAVILAVIFIGIPLMRKTITGT